MDDLTEQMRVELLLLQPGVTQLVGGTCRWNGKVTLTDDPAVKGRKRYCCAIEINRVVATREARWRTLIHELVHAHSVGCTMEAMQEYQGWEEGVVENLQRLIRREVLEAAGIAVDESVFLRDEEGCDLNVFVNAFEEWRTTLTVAMKDGRTPVEFYAGLLQERLAVRPAAALSSRAVIQEPRLVRAYSVLTSRLR